MKDNYPDGVSAADIPGNRKQDDEVEELWEYFHRELQRGPTESEMERILDDYWQWGMEDALAAIDTIYEETEG